MFRPRVIPCLLLKGKGLVKTSKFEDAKYIGDPINAVKIFNDYEADELVFLDIDASKEGRVVDREFVKRVSEEAFMPFAVGGGINSAEQARELVNSGAEKVVLNSSVFGNFRLVREIASVLGEQAVVVCLDVKKDDKKEKYLVFTHGGTKSAGLDAISVAKEMEKAGAGEIIIQSIDNDGIMQGYDLELIKLVSESVSVPVIALGGAGKLEDFALAVKAGASAVSAGSLFVYSGRNKGILINYPDRDELNKVFKI